MTTSEPNFEPVVTVTTAPWPGNAEGEAVYTRPTMARFIVEDGDLPEMKEKSSQALEAAGFPKSDRGKAEAICKFARSVMSYVPDAPMRQTCYRPRYLLCVKGAKLCVKIGNCVNMNCALGALMRAAGLDVKVQGIEYGGGQQDHVNILVHLADENKWAEADATTDAPVGYVSHGKKIVYDPHDPKVTGAAVASGAFIGAGRPMQTISTAQLLFGRDVRPAGRIGAGLTTPGDILAYRQAWDQYVLDTIKCAQSCSAAYAGVASTQTDPTLKQDLQNISTTLAADAQATLNAWNAWQNTTPDVVVVRASEILQDFQAVVLNANQLRQQITTGTLTCVLEYAGPDGPTAAVAAPSKELQAQIIARIEGLGILASGILRIFVGGAGETLKDAGTAAQNLVHTGSWLLSPWVLGTAGILLVGSVGLIVWKADSIARLVSTVREPMRAMEHPKLRRRRRRRKMAA